MKNSAVDKGVDNVKNCGDYAEFPGWYYGEKGWIFCIKGGIFFGLCHRNRRYVDKITGLWKQSKWREYCKK